MSAKEQLVQLATDTPDSLAVAAFFMLKQYLDAVEDAADNAFCMAMEEAFEADTDPEKWEGTSIEALAAEWGVALQ